MTILHIFGWVLAIAATVCFVFKAYIAFDVARDPMSGGGVPTLDGIIFPPIFVTGGVFFIRSMPHRTWGLSAYLLLWLLLTAFAIAVFTLLDRAGTFCRKRQS